MSPVASPAWINSHITVLQRNRRRSIGKTTCSLGPLDENAQHDAAQSSAETPLLDALKLESGRVRANFFCPGHKQGHVVLPQLRHFIGDLPFRADLPELPALDNLFAPEGVLQQSQELAAQVFTKNCNEWHTFFLVNGTTCGIEAAVMACVRPGRKIILPRNVHQSAVHALVLSGAIPVWIEPLYDPEYDLVHGATPEAVSRAFEQHAGQVDAVLIISPTYHGVCSDIASIAAVTHDYDARLIIDEAHGSHFLFHHLLPTAATSAGADIVVQSTHKTLTAFSQAAMMHVHLSSVDQRKIASALQLVQTTSPNYLLLASLEATRALMEVSGEHLMSRTIDLARNAAVRIATLEGMSVLGIENVGIQGPDQNPFVYDIDPTRVTVLLPSSVTGYDLDTNLIDRFGVYAELPSFRHITFVFSIGNTKDDVDNLVTALSLYNATVPGWMPELDGQEFAQRCNVTGEQTHISPRDAFFAESEAVDAYQAVGRISVETLCPYPPGIPVLVAGERVTNESVDTLKAVIDAGGSVSGAGDEFLSTIRVMV